MRCVDSFSGVFMLEAMNQLASTKIKHLRVFSFVPPWACYSVETAGLSWRYLHGLPWNPEICQRAICDTGDSCPVSPGHPSLVTSWVVHGCCHPQGLVSGNVAAKQ